MKRDPNILDAAATTFIVDDEADARRLREVTERAIREGTPPKNLLAVLDRSGRGVLGANDEAALATLCIQVLRPLPGRPQPKSRVEG